MKWPFFGSFWVLLPQIGSDFAAVLGQLNFKKMVPALSSLGLKVAKDNSEKCQPNFLNLAAFLGTTP